MKLAINMEEMELDPVLMHRIIKLRKIFNCPGETKLGGLVALFSGQNLHQ